MASEENKRAVYLAWGLLAFMVKEVDALVSVDNVTDEFIITGMMAKGWTDIGRGATLVEATLDAASLLGILDKDDHQKAIIGFKQYPGVC